jgi:hypothetical protein
MLLPGKAVGCPLGNTQIQEQCEVVDSMLKMMGYNYAQDEYLIAKMTPDVVDDDDCSADP